MSAGEWIGIAMLAAFPIATYRSGSWMGWKAFGVLVVLLLAASTLIRAGIDFEDSEITHSMPLPAPPSA